MIDASPLALGTARVVCIGAGTGQACILRALKGLPASLIAIVSVTDNGGHSGELRRLHDIPQVGDGKQCLIALAEPGVQLQHFAYRFPDDHDQAGQSVGNVLLAEATVERGIAHAFKVWGEKLQCAGLVMPTTEHDVEIVAELSDGREIVGEWEVIRREPRTPIARVRLSEDVPAYEGAIEAIRHADVVIVSPGSFHTGLISTLLPQGINDVIRVSPAQIIMVMNIMTQPGLTDGWDALKHVFEIAPYLGRYPDVVVTNSGDLPAGIREYYATFGSYPIDKGSPNAPLPFTVIEQSLVPSCFTDDGHRPGRFEKWPHIVRHDPEAIRNTIMRALALSKERNAAVVL